MMSLTCIMTSLCSRVLVILIGRTILFCPPRDLYLLTLSSLEAGRRGREGGRGGAGETGEGGGGRGEEGERERKGGEGRGRGKR